MARAQVKDGTLRGCPTCGTKVKDADLALRDFSWVNDALPGRVGGMDIDFCISSARTGRTLLLEMKPPGAFLSTGAKLTFKEFVKKGCDVWVVWGPHPDGQVQVAHVMQDGGLTGRASLGLDELAQLVSVWWDAAQVGEED